MLDEELDHLQNGPWRIRVSVKTCFAAFERRKIKPRANMTRRNDFKGGKSNQEPIWPGGTFWKEENQTKSQYDPKEHFERRKIKSRANMARKNFFTGEKWNQVSNNTKETTESELKKYLNVPSVLLSHNVFTASFQFCVTSLLLCSTVSLHIVHICSSVDFISCRVSVSTFSKFIDFICWVRGFTFTIDFIPCRVWGYALFCICSTLCLLYRANQSNNMLMLE